MTLPFSADAFFDLFAAYNGQLWPAALLLWVGSAWTFLMLLRGRCGPPRMYMPSSESGEDSPLPRVTRSV